MADQWIKKMLVKKELIILMLLIFVTANNLLLLFKPLGGYLAFKVLQVRNLANLMPLSCKISFGDEKEAFLTVLYVFPL